METEDIELDDVDIEEWTHIAYHEVGHAFAALMQRGFVSLILIDQAYATNWCGDNSSGCTQFGLPSARQDYFIIADVARAEAKAISRGDAERVIPSRLPSAVADFRSARQRAGRPTERTGRHADSTKTRPQPHTREMFKAEEVRAALARVGETLIEHRAIEWSKERVSTIHGKAIQAGLKMTESA